jgi:hypothetical protein
MSISIYQYNLVEQHHKKLLKRAEDLFNMVVKENKNLKEKINKLEKEQDNNNILLSYNMSKKMDDYLCQICIDNQRNTVLLPCRHFLCKSCVSKLEFFTCPFCREDIIGSFEVII